MVALAVILKIFEFFPLNQLIWNFIGSMEVTFRSKVAKIVLVGYPRWPPWPPSWNLYWTLESKGQLTRNLSGNQVSDIGSSWSSCLILHSTSLIISCKNINYYVILSDIENLLQLIDIFFLEYRRHIICCEKSLLLTRYFFFGQNILQEDYVCSTLSKMWKQVQGNSFKNIAFA